MFINSTEVNKLSFQLREEPWNKITGHFSNSVKTTPKEQRKLGTTYKSNQMSIPNDPRRIKFLGIPKSRELT